MDKLLDTYALSKLSHEEIENLNRLISYNKIEFVSNSLLLKKQKTENKKRPGPDGSTAEIY